MTHIYSTQVYDSSGKNVTGSFSPDALTIKSISNNPNQSFLWSDKSVQISPDVNSVPLVSLDTTKKRGNVFGDPEKLWGIKRSDIYTKLTINGSPLRYKNGNTAYLYAQDFVVDDSGNTYVSFNCGTITQVANNGGPMRVSIAGETTEYQNVTPIAKISSSGQLLGVEYVLGIVHAAHLCLWKDKDGNDTIGFSIYSEGIGTRTETTLPANWNNSWTPYFVPSSTAYVSFEGFKTSGLFTSFNGNDSSVFLPSALYKNVGKKCTRFADEVETFGASSHNIKQSYVYDDEGKNILLGISITGKTKSGIDFSSQNIFHFDLDSSDTTKYNIPNNLISNGNSSWGNRTLQSFYLRGVHKYLSYGSKNTGERGTSLSILNITQPKFNGQSIISQKDFTFDATWEELEGIYVDKSETFVYVINLYTISGSLEIHLHKHKLSNIY